MKLKLSSFILGCINEVYVELDQKGILFKPKYYITDIWGVTNKVPILGIPYSYCYPIFKVIEEDNISFDMSNRNEILKTIRHEIGHCFCYAYMLYERLDWNVMFGNFYKPYKNNGFDGFHPDLNSTSFVENLSNYNRCYAQVHPDEDFAETFAVWLDRYYLVRGHLFQEASLKLEYVDRVMKEIKDKKPLVKDGKKDKPYRFVKLS
jgi:hypothetical protein